ncbi:hypothetical protein DNTS_032313 [Danionella cerebrum]|uniref:A kinase (PRKA) interacting protein 1 n=1 Tax=Danionella cerebrum TaxID=2873325 RepID=A0A553QIC9_9TELE|nr:hypothetical protein DNTS_032313 [Danionella translucida]
MAHESWMESSLKRSSKLGHEVLEKAKRRSAGFSRPRSAARFSEKFFDNFYRSAEVTSKELEHVCHYHSQQMLKTIDQKQNITLAMTGKTGSGEPEDFFIEVSPGTYSITAAMEDTTSQTKTVSISAGQSMSLTFNL